MYRKFMLFIALAWQLVQVTQDGRRDTRMIE